MSRIKQMMMMKKRNTKERMRQKWMHRSSKHKVMMGRKLKAIKKILNKMNTLKEKMCLSRRWKRERHLRKGSLKMVEEERIKRLRR